ncbi:uncharacterized protein B0I36DRAFT_362134 [Microdochium trichocladiopsis]|uniref:Uncharacterized protein n=1 Tax=Microdochium trichocladiopsis TaxID=1682393 RepID=A0A9P8Y9X7_9PEZI|nr:uncharacterized protein B0I36DRAFT_362134 [Microdochium trichocladiopsis]KAH7033470.1 hypothetical protein B0I36DRAFT_362134 [Microdochium trichocladiopsis]
MLAQDRIRRKPMHATQDPAVYAHSRTRTTSSSVFPGGYPQAPLPLHLQQPPSAYGHSRRSPSVGTFSTVASSNAPPAAFRTSPTSELRRSTSSRSGGSTQPTSYVALLRKQKATVWCDRAQYEDPRLVAQQKAAKHRASQEVSGRTGGRTSTGISGPGKVAAKIRHHGKPGVVGYAPENNYIGVGGVPMRLSATEVEGEDSDDDDPAQRLHHRRTGSSGRSSTASRRGNAGYRTSTILAQGSTGKRWSPNGSTLEDQGPFQPGEPVERAQSTHSGSSAERADALPDLAPTNAARMASNSLLNAALTREKSVRNPEDLKRRGSVDERTMTLTSGRLFIANPD